MPVTVAFEGVEAGTKAELTLLTGTDDPFGYNDPWTGVNVVTTTKKILEAGEDGFQFTMPELSVAVLDTQFSDDEGAGEEPSFGEDGDEDEGGDEESSDE